eukprot:scaffold98082_cov37-Tisochrysis_lutea.AAC.4
MEVTHEEQLVRKSTGLSSIHRAVMCTCMPPSPHQVSTPIRSAMEAHYTVMDAGLLGNATFVCADQNMVAVSNPCVLDKELAPEGTIVIHAYGCGNEPYEIWEGVRRGSAEYEELKRKRAEVLWRAVERVIPDAKNRVKVIGRSTALGLHAYPTHFEMLERDRRPEIIPLSDMRLPANSSAGAHWVSTYA